MFNMCLAVFFAFATAVFFAYASVKLLGCNALFNSNLVSIAVFFTVS